jgi:hypothetical protein
MARESLRQRLVSALESLGGGLQGLLLELFRDRTLELSY